jgi:hypothetical protein
MPHDLTTEPEANAEAERLNAIEDEERCAIDDEEYEE